MRRDAMGLWNACKFSFYLNFSKLPSVMFTWKQYLGKILIASSIEHGGTSTFYNFMALLAL